MREIKFRGKCVDTGEWVYGYYLVTGPFYYDLKKHVIAILGKVCDYAGLKFVDVIPESVGQFTGLHDKNGREIYEGDVIRFKMSHKAETWDGVVRYAETVASYMIYSVKGESWFCREFGIGTEEIEIIGNILEARP